MKYNLVRTANPTIEPITLTEAKDFLRLTESVDINNAIPLSTYAPATITSEEVNVAGMVASVIFNVGTVEATATIALTVEDSNDNSSWSTIETFTVITAANDNAEYTYDYAGTKMYLRVVAIVATASASFSVVITTVTVDTEEDTLLSSLIVLAREYCEDFQNRAYITQTWEMALPYFPFGEISIPKGNLQTVDSIKYTDADGVETTWSPSEYLVSIRGILGRVAPQYGVTYPSFVPSPLDAVVIEFTCGYGDAAADVPERVKFAMKALITHWYENRALLLSSGAKNEAPWSVRSLLLQDKVVVM